MPNPVYVCKNARASRRVIKRKIKIVPAKLTARREEKSETAKQRVIDEAGREPRQKETKPETKTTKRSERRTGLLVCGGIRSSQLLYSSKYKHSRPTSREAKGEANSPDLRTVQSDEGSVKIADPKRRMQDMPAIHMVSHFSFFWVFDVFVPSSTCFPPESSSSGINHILNPPPLVRGIPLPGTNLTRRAHASSDSLQTVFGVRALVTSMTSSRWLHMATNRSKNSLLPPASISACMVPLRLNVLRQRMIRAR